MATKAPSTSMRVDLARQAICTSSPTSASGIAAADELRDLAVPDDLDVGIGEQPVLQDLLGAQRIAAVDQGHVVAVVGEVERFLDRGVAAADHRDLLAAIEEAVAGRAGRRAPALHMLFGRQAEPLGLGAGRDHQRVGKIFAAAVAAQPERPARQVDLEMWSQTILVPTCSAWACISSISHGPWMTSRKPG